MSQNCAESDTGAAQRFKDILPAYYEFSGVLNRSLMGDNTLWLNSKNHRGFTPLLGAIRNL